jgi:hypothetical protein
MAGPELPLVSTLSARSQDFLTPLLPLDVIPNPLPKRERDLTMPLHPQQRMSDWCPMLHTGVLDWDGWTPRRGPLAQMP